MEGLVRLLRGYQSGGMPGFVHCPGTDPLGGGGLAHCSDIAAILLGLKLNNSFPFLHRYVTLIGGSHHLISQAGWNRCNLSIYLLLDFRVVSGHIRDSICFLDLPGGVLAAPALAWVAEEV